jgi:hypothetical protein
MSTLLFRIAGKIPFPAAHRDSQETSGPLRIPAGMDVGVRCQHILPAEAVLLPVDPHTPEDFEDGSGIVGRVEHGFRIVELVSLQDFANRVIGILVSDDPAVFSRELKTKEGLPP